MEPTRRTFVAGVGAAVTGLAGANTVLAQEDSSLQIVDADREGEYVVIENQGDSAFDLSGYYMEFEYKQNVSQRRQFPADTVIAAGSTLVVATGAREVPDADVTFNYEGSVIRNDEVDYLAILTPDESTVVATYSTSGTLPGTATPEPTPEATETPEPTPAETETPEPTPEETQTPEETETPEPTPEETETPEQTETPEPTPEETETPASTPEETETPEPTETPDEPDDSDDTAGSGGAGGAEDEENTGSDSDSDSSDDSPVEEDGC